MPFTQRLRNIYGVLTFLVFETQDGAETGFTPGDDLCEQIRKGADAVGQLEVARRRLAGMSGSADTATIAPRVSGAERGGLPHAAGEALMPPA